MEATSTPGRRRPDLAGPSTGQGLEDVLGALPALAPALADPQHTVTDLSGGLTNHNHRVRGGGLDAVVRVSPAGTELLAIDRENEFHNSSAAAAAGVGAPVLDYLPGRGVLVVGFLPGRTYGNADVAANLPRVAAALRALHAGPAFAGHFDMVRVQRGYEVVCELHGIPLPPGYAELDPYAARVATALAADPEPLVPCHNDLLAANILDAGPGSGVGVDGLSIIDYEYSGMNEPSFELGNVVQEARLTPDHLAELCTAYYGADHPRLAARTARAELWGAYAAYGWVLWGTIQRSMSEVDADFETWAQTKLDAATTALTSPRLDLLLDQVTAP